MPQLSPDTGDKWNTNQETDPENQEPLNLTVRTAGFLWTLNTHVSFGGGAEGSLGALKRKLKGREQGAPKTQGPRLPLAAG